MFPIWLYCAGVHFVLLQCHLIAGGDRKAPRYQLRLACKCFQTQEFLAL